MVAVSVNSIPEMIVIEYLCIVLNPPISLRNEFMITKATSGWGFNDIEFNEIQLARDSWNREF